MLRTAQFEDLSIITTGRGIFGQYLYLVYCYLLEDLLIDTGTLLSQEPLLKFLKDKKLNTVVNTHAQEDHIGNNRALTTKRDVVLYAHKEAIKWIEDPRLLNLRAYQRIMWGEPYPSNPDEIPDEIKTKSYSLEVIPTPGHCMGHICLYEPSKKWLFSGDLNVGKLSLMTNPFVDLLQTLVSLRKLSKYDVSEIFCAHIGHLTNGNAIIQKKLTFLEEAKAQAEKLYSEHVLLIEVVKEVAGRESFLKVITRGHLSNLNGIKSLLSLK